MTGRPGGVLLVGGIVVAVAAIVAGILVAGTPGEGRMRRFDQLRERDLRAIVTSIDRWWRQHDELPDSLGGLATDPRTSVATKDPETGESYEYRIVGEDTYELCTTFSLASIPQPRLRDPFWEHEAGRRCFSLQAVTPPESDVDREPEPAAALERTQRR